ncbi:hypothetical protein Tco_0377997 [Tanacetum coccineum]
MVTGTMTLQSYEYSLFAKTMSQFLMFPIARGVRISKGTALRENEVVAQRTTEPLHAGTPILDKFDYQKVVEHEDERVLTVKWKAQMAKDKAAGKRSATEGSSRRTKKKNTAPMSMTLSKSDADDFNQRGFGTHHSVSPITSIMPDNANPAAGGSNLALESVNRTEDEAGNTLNNMENDTEEDMHAHSGGGGLYNDEEDEQTRKPATGSTGHVVSSSSGGSGRQVFPQWNPGGEGIDDSESDTEIPKRHVSPTPHDAMLTRWRSRVASRSSSPTTSTPEIPTAPILPAPSAIVAPSSEFPLALGIDREEVGSSSSHSSSDHSSFGHSIMGHSLSGHTPPDTTDVDSSTPPRFVHPSLARTSRCSEAYLCWRSAPLSTMYLPTTSESLGGDSSSESSARPSRKKCKSPATTVTLPIHAMRALVPSRVDLLPPCKRFRDSISPEDSVEEDINTDVLEDIKADVTAIEVTIDTDVEAGIDAGIGMEVDVGVDVEDEVEDEVESSDRRTIEVGVDVVVEIDIPDAMLMPDAVERLEQVEEGLQDIYDHVIEIPLQRIEDIEMGQKIWSRGVKCWWR